MNVHWHALAEQLQQHPDLLEEELQGEVVAMSAQAEVQSAPEKELEVLKHLQARLGNHALQRLLSGTTLVEEETPAVEKPSIEAEPAESLPGALPETEPAAAPATEPMAVDTRRQLHGLLRRMLSQLPRLDVIALEILADLFDQQSPELQASIVAMVVSHSQALPESEQEVLLEEISKLSGAVVSSRLISALLARLLAVVPSHPAAVAEPEPSEA